MKPARDWRDVAASPASPSALEVVASRSGEPTLRRGDIWLHSRYNPREEAARFVGSAHLVPTRPVLVVGLGLGYAVLELERQGFTVAAVEPDSAVAALALAGPMQGAATLLGIGDPDAWAGSRAFADFAAQQPQVLVHPATARLHPDYPKAVEARVVHAALDGRRLGIAVVGPMYGGSLPIAGYLERAFRALGHRTLLVDNAGIWPVYEAVTSSVGSKAARNHLTNALVNWLAEWVYVRTVEFGPDVCIVLAQAPAAPDFAARLAQRGIVTAFWFVENWRHMTYWRDIAPRYDYFFHIQPGEFEQRLAEVGCRRQATVYTGCDPDIHAPCALTCEEQQEFGCDISFAGAGYFNRNQLFSGLTDYAMKLWGVDWSVRELQRFVCRPDTRFSPQQFAKIAAATKINLNLHSSATHPGVDPRCDAVNPRVFELAACGAFQICDPCRGLDRLFEFETEIPVYRDLAELRRKIDYYLARPDERAAIAARARDRALREHTYQHRARQMLALLLDAYGARMLEKGVRVQRTVAEMAPRVAADGELAAYLASLPSDMLFLPEPVNARIPVMGTRLSHAEAVFAYLREVRNSAEALLEAFD